MSSIRQIAKQTGVSPATVSRALRLHPDISPETRRKVVQAANALGYAGTAAARNDWGVAMLVDSHRALSLYDCLLLNGLRRALMPDKLDVQFVDVARDKAEDESYTAFFQQRGVRGVVTTPGSNDARLCAAIAAEHFPLVSIGERFEGDGWSYVCCDSTDASARALEHLLHLGHQRIGLALPPFADHDHTRREQGYRQALRDNGVAIDESLLCHVDPALEGGYAAVSELMSHRDPPTAIFFADPYPAIGAVARAQEVGLSVPGQLSIVGYDDGRMRRQVYPMLTAVVQPTEALGEAAGRWLSSAVGGWAEGPLRQVLPASLEINQTSGAPSGPGVRMQPDGQRLAG